MTKKNKIQNILYLIICLVLAAIVFSIFAHKPGINGYHRAMVVDMVYGKAYKPFVYRVLLPTTVRFLAAAIPSKTRTFLDQSIGEDPIVHEVFSKLRWENEYLIEYGIALVLMYLSLLGFVFALRYFLTGVFDVPNIFRDVVPLIALLGLPPFFKYHSYLYDFPTLFLFTLGLGLMVRAKWRPFLFIFFIACLNKETTILLTMIFAIHFFNKERMDRFLFVRLLMFQLTVFFIVKAALFFIFRNNPGTFVEFHLFDHNIKLLRPYSLPSIFVWISIIVLVLYKWSNKPDFLKHSLWILVPLLFLNLLFGYLDELRNYYEVYPIIILLSAHTIGNILDIRVNLKRNNGYIA